MKKIYMILSLSWATVAMAQNNIVSTFEVFQLGVDSFLNGNEKLNNPTWRGYSSGGAIFQNVYDTSFGGFWSKGFAISTMRDDTTAGFTNLYSAITASGFSGSEHYAVGQNNARIYRDIDSFAAKGVYVTNTTYAALSMLNGDDFAKAFGGATGNDPDFFLMTFVGYRNGNVTDSVEFYLADYRFADNDSDYIVDEWEWVDLTRIGQFDSIQIKLASSDMSGGFINTPAFYAIDNFEMVRITGGGNTGLRKLASNNQLKVYPNPASQFISIEGLQQVNIRVYDIVGKEVLISQEQQIDISGLTNGTYMVIATDTNGEQYKTKFIKH
jgi:hypothetical protein